MILAGIVILGALVVIALITILNAVTFSRLMLLNDQTGFHRPVRSDFPYVSVLVPARDEARRIKRTVASLLSQDYPAFELVLLDDNSQDDTSCLAQEAARGDARFRLVHGTPLPEAWTGKNWACQQLSEHARADLLVYTDADVTWQANALSALVKQMEQTRADMLAVWPTQEMRTWAERLVVPMMIFTILSYLPELCVRYLPWPVFAAANGQCLAFRRVAYLRMGGHQAVRSSIVEDMSLAWNAKRRRLRLVMSLGNGLITARMYENWHEVRDGFAKNILAGHGGRPLFLILSAVFHWTLFLLPWVWITAGLFVNGMVGWPAWPMAMVALGLGVRALSAAVAQDRLSDALLLPISVLLMSYIAALSLWWHYRYGGPRWKGRQIYSRT